MSAKTLHLHHDKHHQAYVTNLNNLIEGTEFAGKSLEEIVTGSYGDAAKQGIFNNAGQHWNHNLFWRIMKKGGGGNPGGELAKRIDDAFGSFEAFKEQFKTAGVTQFGSGWAWLACEGDQLKVVKTPNGENPLVHGHAADPGHRRLGARLLRRLREPSARVRGGLPQPAGQLERGRGGIAQGPWLSHKSWAGTGPANDLP